MNIRPVIAAIILLPLFTIPTCRKSEYLIENVISVKDYGSGTGTVTWTSDNSYSLDGFVFVNDGQTLTIEAGTVIRAKTGQGYAASALIVARGGKIFAEGTSDNPIIFTVEGDDLRGSVPTEAQGLWGGVIILGNAGINLEFSESIIEGIPVTEPRGVYGGNIDNDNSGILRYVSIRHGGTNIGEGNEINGLTLGGVGSETIIEYVEVISNADDGVEFFGGTVNCKYLIVAFCGDDAFDYDEGYRGNGQFWLAIQNYSSGDVLGECDGGIFPENGQPYSIPLIYNVTYIGNGIIGNNSTLTFRRNAGGIYANSIFLNQAKGVELEYKNGVECSFSQFLNNNLEIKNNIFYNIANNAQDSIFKVVSNNTTDLLEQNSTFREYFSMAGNEITDAGIGYVNDKLSLIPSDYSFSNLAPYPSDWYDHVNFKGAFGTYNWISGWTLLSKDGYILE